MAGPAARRQPPERPRFTGRAAVLVVVVCAVALSLAYPVREYIAQRRQIDQLLAQQQQLTTQLSKLGTLRQQLRSSSYIEQQAEARLHLCPPSLTCYTIIGGRRPGRRAAARRVATSPWYQRLWSSVEQADKIPGRRSGRGPGH